MASVYFYFFIIKLAMWHNDVNHKHGYLKDNIIALHKFWNKRALNANFAYRILYINLNSNTTFVQTINYDLYNFNAVGTNIYFAKYKMITWHRKDGKCCSDEK